MRMSAGTVLIRLRDTWLPDNGYLPPDLASILIRAQAAPGEGINHNSPEPRNSLSQI
ncbi:hypothetical protein XFF6166_1060008 [Xanthomonas citri pv. fuscans]|nr:hypothetical protein XFF6166_1060008 [Xanthomonas citri pv. fuscans]SON98336.1 hypothetical protein XFF7767_1020036 [Xanthomonas citri pv. fuscans]SOO04105.1 hypothetical protein XFF6960_930035 [Xanthomonas citri pv. fuscans]SOO11503.1 hypothetical protein XFF6970_890008 [Xanthomonas citri pv. fuscans]SOO16099.1 hypothetical protein XFF7766_730050 [Xanthomonas citri pv. fuscans]